MPEPTHSGKATMRLRPLPGLAAVIATAALIAVATAPVAVATPTYPVPVPGG